MGASEGFLYGKTSGTFPLNHRGRLPHRVTLQECTRIGFLPEACIVFPPLTFRHWSKIIHRAESQFDTRARTPHRCCPKPDYCLRPTIGLDLEQPAMPANHNDYPVPLGAGQAPSAHHATHERGQHPLPAMSPGRKSDTATLVGKMRTLGSTRRITTVNKPTMSGCCTFRLCRHSETLQTLRMSPRERQLRSDWHGE